MSKDKGGRSDKKVPAKSQKEKKAAKAAKKKLKNGGVDIITSN